MNRTELVLRAVLQFAVRVVGWMLIAVATSVVAAAPAITDESKVPPYALPDPLVCVDGSRVTDAKIWRDKRRPELLRFFENEMYGRMPIGRPADLKFVVRDEKKDARGGKATRLRVGVLFEGREAGRQMELLIYLPNSAKRPAPLIFGLNFDGNYTTTDEADLPVPKHFANGLFANKVRNNTPEESGRGAATSLWQYDYALDHGYAVATAAYGEIEPDANDRGKEGPRGLAPEPGPGDWGSIGAWAWGMSRAMDYFETNPRIDAKRVAVTGFSRIGKAALWAGACDERFALVISNCSGGGGAALSKRIFGETVENLAKGPGRWFCKNFGKYAGKEADLPMDQHELIALVAPRPVLILSATEDLWADPKGEFLAGVGADLVYRLLGADGISQKEWPAAEKLLDSRIGYYLRVGKHDVTADDWRAMIAYADKQWGK